MNIQEAITVMANKIQIPDKDILFLDIWLYIFTKGYVSNLRSRRALPNDYWTAETLEDFMRCKAINFPIGDGVEQERVRDFFKTWIIGRRLSTEQEQHKKNLFVVKYNKNTRFILISFIMT